MSDSGYVATALNVNMTQEGFSSVRTLMSATDKSFAQIARDAVRQFAERDNPDMVVEVSQDYIDREKEELTGSSVRLPTYLSEVVDNEAIRAGTDRTTMASFITECYLYDQLVFLQSSP